MVFESDAAGTLIEIVAGEGDTLPIGEVIARVGEPGEAAEPGTAGSGGSGRDSSAVPAPPASPDPRVHAADIPAEAPAAHRPLDERLATPTQQPTAAEAGRADQGSPLARRIAEEKGVDLASLRGRGPGGGSSRSTSRAREAGAAPRPRRPRRRRRPRRPPGAAERPETAKGTVEVVELTKLQQTVGRRMAESKATAPHFYLQAEIDMTAAWEARARLKAVGARGRGGPVVQRHGGQGLRDRAARVPARQRRLPRRQVGALLAGQRRDRGRRPGGARRADRLRRRPARACGRSRPRRGRSRRGSARGRSRRPSSRAAPSPSPTSACTGSPTSTR